ncbi:MAG TPA: hypothetical protein VG322_01430 [Candidatus Acidoferrales bacterium]|nr:hypothetical protein [Candidatus Acidoferrales bacterium]
MSATPENREHTAGNHDHVDIPSPTAWPFVLAVGFALAIAGLVTTPEISVLGGVLVLAGSVGWFRDVLPHEQEETVRVIPAEIVIATSRRELERIDVAPELKRLRFPMEIYPIKSGVRGGLVGSVAMAAVAMLYGLIDYHSIWYPVNLVGAVVYARELQMSVARLSQFSIILLLVALAIHLTVSLLVGLLYGTLLPMLPRHPILLGGVIAPLVWSGVVHASLGIINPLLNQRIDWMWFLASQVAFGCVAGLVVIRHAPVHVRQFMPLAMRAGIEATGLRDEKHEGDHAK